MKTMIAGCVDVSNFQRLAEMFNSPFRDQGEKLLELALAELKEEHSRICLRFIDEAYGKARFLECALLRDDLKQAFDDYAGNEISADELREIIAHAAKRSSEIADDASTSGETPGAAPAPAVGLASPPPKFIDDFVIPPAGTSPSCVSVAVAPESSQDDPEEENTTPEPYEDRLKKRVFETLDLWPELLWPLAFLVTLWFWYIVFAVFMGGRFAASDYLFSWSHFWFWLIVWPFSTVMLLPPALGVYEALRMMAEEDDDNDLLDSVLDLVRDTVQAKNLRNTLFVLTLLIIIWPILPPDGTHLISVVHPPSLPSLSWLTSFAEIVGGLIGGGVLLALLRKLLPIFGFLGLSLKIALFIDCFFVCYLVGFHETPWGFMHGAPFPDLAKPVWPFIIACVLGAGIVSLPEVSEWVLARPSRLRKVFFLAIVLIVISVFVVRDRMTSSSASQALAASAPLRRIRPAPPHISLPKDLHPIPTCEEAPWDKNCMVHFNPERLP